MSDQTALNPAEIPKFTGNLEQLEKDVSALSTDAFNLWDAGSQIDTRFKGLSAYYEAPEAEKLFATTAPVAKAGDELCTEVGTVASALSAYASEIRPIVAKFESLRHDAAAFASSIADDDDWREDADLVDENNARRNEVNAAWAAFQAAERTCYGKIVALIGGAPLTVNDGSNKEGMYGYRAEDLNNAQGLPWGDPVEESTPWYQIHEHLWDFTKGFFVDGVWGTIKGLGTLVGFDGWDAAGQAWTGLGKLLTGLVITGMPIVGTAYWLVPDDKLPSWLRDSRTAVVETGKALIAYDEWGKNPSRAAGAVTFNVLTTVFTGGTGTAAKTGAIAKAISFAGKAGRIVDPMTYVAKGVGVGITRLGDVMASLKAVTNGTYIKLADSTFKITDQPLKMDDLPAGLTPENTVRMETPKGEVVFLDTKTLVMHNADGTVRESLADIAHEGTAAERATSEHGATPGRDGELVGVGAHTADTAGTVGRGGDPVGTGGTGSHLPGGHGTDTLPPRTGGHGTGGTGGTGGFDGLDDLGRGGDDGLGAGTHADDTAGPTGGDHTPGEPQGGRPAEGTPREIMQRHVDLANNDPAWFKEHYRSNGYRRFAEEEVFGQRLPTLVPDPANPGKWISKSDLPPAIPAKYVDTGFPSGARTTIPSDTLHQLDNWAHNRQHAITADNTAEANLEAAEKAYKANPTPELEAARDAAEAAHSPLHGDMLKQSELFGENVAETHAIPEHYPNATRVDDGAFGNNRFDQVYRTQDGRYVVVEAKGSTTARLGDRTSHLGNRVQQGTREYFQTILHEMEKRAQTSNNVDEMALAQDLRRALKNGDVDYVLVKADATKAGTYAGYEMKQFDIGKPGSN
ncbi:hypothetical protein ABZS84_30240 [Streptomyces sp. NPDC005481]|uniref:hypothetical protein n=1 Tax=Streptomyces sp. NPDC005481 TaxID=3154881 RepID=UPI0033A75399